MIKVEVIEKFILKDFDELKNVERRSADERGKLFVGDTFECSEDMVKYLMGDNPLKRAFVRVVEVAPKKGLVVLDTKAESENIVPLDKEKANKLGEELQEVIKPTKKKSSKKKTK